jgi:tRNA modification GTPase
MDYHVEDTICAVASAPGGAVRGIVRLSGPDTVSQLAKFFSASDGTQLASIQVARLVPGCLTLESLHSPLPCDLYLWPTSRSYTRQPAAELHLVGSPPLLDEVVRQLGTLGVRMAEPGEFTLRAFLAGRLDLTQVEAVLAVVDAQDRDALHTALSQLAGDLSGPLQQLRADLVETLSHLEAGLDFADEDIHFIEPTRLTADLETAIAETSRILSQVDTRRHTESTFRVVLRGWPNAGKSSLMNALTAQQVSLVSAQAGTTRDYIVRSVEYQGMEFQFIDTAGVDQWTSESTIEASAQELGHQQLQLADLEILCLDSTQPRNAWELARISESATAKRLVVLTKIDQSESHASSLPGAIPTSSLDGSGIKELREQIFRRATESRAEYGVDGAAPTASSSSMTRCCGNLSLMRDALLRARQLVAEGGGDELVAMELREALHQLGRIVGVVYTDEILDHIFGQFCIGK